MIKKEVLPAWRHALFGTTTKTELFQELKKIDSKLANELCFLMAKTKLAAFVVLLYLFAPVIVLIGAFFITLNYTVTVGFLIGIGAIVLFMFLAAILIVIAYFNHLERLRHGFLLTRQAIILHTIENNRGGG